MLLRFKLGNEICFSVTNYDIVKLTNPYFEPAEDMGMFMEMLNALT